MADELLSDDERAEALREWWRDNWPWIIGGVVLGIALLVGWHYWGIHKQQQAEQAGALYREVQTALTVSDAGKAQESLTRLTSDFDSSEYTQQARLIMAKAHVEAGKYSEAETLLREAAEKSKRRTVGADRPASSGAPADSAGQA